MAVVPRRAKSQAAAATARRPKRAGRGSLGRAWHRDALAFARMRLHPRRVLPHARTAHPHRTRHGGANVVHDLAQAAPHCRRARLPRPSTPPKPGGLRLAPDSPLQPSCVAAFDGARGGGAPDVEGTLVEAELLEAAGGAQLPSPGQPLPSAARLTAAPRSFTGRIGCYPTGGPGSRPGRPLFPSVSCRRCLRVRASSLGHAWPSQASKWAGLSQWCHVTTLRNVGSGAYM